MSVVAQEEKEQMQYLLQGKEEVATPKPKTKMQCLRMIFKEFCAHLWAEKSTIAAYFTSFALTIQAIAGLMYG